MQIGRWRLIKKNHPADTSLQEKLSLDITFTSCFFSAREMIRLVLSKTRCSRHGRAQRRRASHGQLHLRHVLCGRAQHGYTWRGQTWRGRARYGSALSMYFLKYFEKMRY
jgi:hypothetical protein